MIDNGEMAERGEVGKGKGEGCLEQLNHLTGR